MGLFHLSIPRTVDTTNCQILGIRRNEYRKYGIWLFVRDKADCLRDPTIAAKSRRRQERKAHPSNMGRGASQTADPTFHPLEHKPLCSTAGLTSGQATELCSIIIKENAMVFHSGKYASVPHSF